MLSTADLDRPVTERMRTDFTCLSPDATVGETLERLRRDPPGERIVYFYVLDAQSQLCGVVPTRKLLLSATEVSIRDIMFGRVLSIPSTATVRDACEFFAIHRFLAVPVVDAARKVVGVIDIELYASEVTELTDAEELNEIFQSLGVYADERSNASAPRAFLRRFPWLGSNLIGGLICALTASLYQAELSRVVALSLFIPVVLNLAESVSSQSVSLTLHALRGQRPTWKFFLAAIRRESATGLMLGLACGAVVGVAALIWLHQTHVALAILGGIGFGVTVSALLGLTLPVTLRLLQLDPKVAAGPIALAAADIATLFAYLAAARWLLG